MKKKLEKNINKYIDSNPVRFHMPGHKGRNKKEYYKMDVTELSFNDNLIHPQNIIKDLNNEISRIFNTKKSYILVNGSTSGIISSFICTLNKNDKIIIPRNSHISAFYGLYLSKAKPIYYYPKDIDKGLSGEEYIKAVKDNIDAKAIFITYPNYYGYCFDIKQVCKKIKEINKDILIIVDEAHGTHMYFSDEYPDSALDAKSDIVITSMHKTLEGLTQTSLLHVNSEIVDIRQMDIYYKMTTSTSPSYLLLESVENATFNAKNNAYEKLNHLKEIYIDSKNKIEKNTSFYFEEFNSLKHDYLKICINTTKSSLSGYKLSKLLEEKYNIYVEASTSKYCLCYLGINSNSEDVSMLVNALINIEKEVKDSNEVENNIYDNYKAEHYCDMERAIKSSSNNIDLKNSEGFVVQDFIVPYPPGYPVLIPGEIMTKEILLYLLNIQNNHEIIGIENGRINVVRKEDN